MNKVISIVLFKNLEPFLDFKVYSDNSMNYYIKSKTDWEDCKGPLWIEKVTELKMKHYV